jgi:CarboxypepD_reg-like domain/Outer membrane protein beta-barrel family
MSNKLIWFILTFHSFKLFAQDAPLLRGYVKDTLGKPLPYASVYTQGSDSTAIISFISTDIEGFFQLKCPQSPRFLVKVAALGYEAQSLWVETNTIKNILTFNLAPKNFVLKEAIVTAKTRAQQIKDTITFKADMYRDSTERNLEQLLAKIPGIDVSKDGVISVQGKPIKKILIEGDDLTGHNYQLLSQNMTADVVDKIQIIDRFTENKLLKGIKKSTDKVINITIKENRKSLIFGNILGGLGNEKRTNDELNLMTVNPKIKVVNFAKFNTIGQNSTAGRLMNTDFGNDIEAVQQRALLNNKNARLININRTPSVQLSSQSVQFNQSVSASSHFIVHPKKVLTVKGGFVFNQDKIRAFLDNDYQYLLPDSIFTLSETNVLNNRPKFFEAKLDAEWDISQKSALHIVSEFQKTSLIATATSVANNNQIANNLTDKNDAWQTSIDFTHRINDRKALTINTVWIKNGNEQNLNIEQILPRQLATSLSQPFLNLNQQIGKPMMFVSSIAQFLTSSPTLDVSLNCGWVIKSEDLNSTLLLDKLLVSETFLNNNFFKQKNYFLGINLSRNWHLSHLFFNVSGGFYDQLMKGKQGENIEKKSFYTLPTIGFQWKKEKKSIFLTYGYNFSLPQITDVSNGYVLTDYRNVVRGSTILIPSNSHTFISNYNYGNFTDEFLINLNGIYSIQQGGYRPNFSIDRDFNFTSKVENIFHANSLTLSGRLERYLSNLYLRFRLKPTVTVLAYQNVLNQSFIRETRQTNTNVDFSVRSAYLKWFNYHIGGNLAYAKVSTKTTEGIKNIKNQVLGSYIDFHLRFGKHWTAKLDNEFLSFHQAQNQRESYFFSNISTSFDIIPSKLSLNLNVKNLLNTQSFISNSISDYFINTNRIRLLPRYILAEVNFKF